MPRRDAPHRPASPSLLSRALCLACVCVALALVAACGDDGSDPVDIQSNNAATNNSTTSTNNSTTSTNNATTSTNSATTSTNNATTSTNSSTTSTNNATTTPSALERACEQACARFVACLELPCSGPPEDIFPVDLCYEGCLQDPTLEEVEAFLGLACDEVEEIACDNFEAIAEQCACEDVPDDLPQLCVDACSHTQGCLEDVCSDDLPTDRRACIDTCLENAPPREALERAIARSCDDIFAQACEENPELDRLCPCTPPAPLGSPCQDSEDCAPAGELAPLCLPERDPDTDAPTGYAGGYCAAVGCVRDEDCGERDLCIPQTEGGLCFTSCDVSLGRQDCRDGYGCWPFDGDLGACLPQCTSDADCGGVSACDPDIGACR